MADGWLDVDVLIKENRTNNWSSIVTKHLSSYIPDHISTMCLPSGLKKILKSPKIQSGRFGVYYREVF